MLRVWMIVMCDRSCCHRGRETLHHTHHHFPERGWVQFLFLRLLYEGPMHGYQVNDELERRGLLPVGRLESGSIYTILRRMEHRGLLDSEWERAEAGPDRRVYRITNEGIGVLRSGLESILRRKALMDDLAAFYNRNFQKKSGEQG
jgi:PadR family transcriptional regulator PadR